MEIILLVAALVGLMALSSRVSRHRVQGDHRQFYADGLMTQEIEALKIEATQPVHKG